MSVVVREMLALFVAKVQDGSFNAIERRIAGLQRAAVALGASFAGTQLYDMVEEASRFEDARRIFVQAGGDLAKLRVETKGMLSDFELVKGFNLAEQFGLSRYFSDFVKISDVAAKKFGITQAEAFQRIIKGTARGSAPILDNLGIQLVGQKGAIKEAFARAHGKSVADLTGIEISQAYAEAAIAQSQKMLKQMTESGAITSDTFDRLRASTQNLKTAVGELGLSFGPLIDKFSLFANHLVLVFQRLKNDPEFQARLESAGLAVEYVARGALTLWRDAVTVYDILPVKTAVVIAGLWKWRAALLAISAASTTALSVGAAQWALIAFLSSGVVAAAATTAALTGLAAVAAIAVEEVAAAFDPDVDGFFETWALNWGALEEQVTAKLDTDTGLAAFLDYCLFALIDIEKKLVDVIGWALNLDEQGDELSPFMRGPFAVGDDSGPRGANTGMMAEYMNGMLDSQKKEFLARVRFGQAIPDAAHDVDSTYTEDAAAWHFQQYLQSHPALLNEMGASNDHNAYAPHVYSPTVHVTVNGAGGADAQQMSMMIREQVDSALEDHAQEMSLSLRPGVP